MWAPTDVQLTSAETVFNDFGNKDLQPAYLADADATRTLLGFDDSIYQVVRRLAAKWAAAPSVHGSKRQPQDAGLVV